MFRESIVPAALQLLFHMNTSKDNSSHLSRICSFLVDQVIHKILWNTIRSSDNPLQLLLCKYLSACIMVTSICLAILISILCHHNFKHLVKFVCECSRSSVLFKILPLVQTSLQTWAGVRQIKPWLIVDLCLFNLLVFDQSLYFWSPDLETIIPLHLSFELVSCFYNLTSLNSFFFWLSTNTHIRSIVDLQVLCWILSDNILHIQ